MENFNLVVDHTTLRWRLAKDAKELSTEEFIDKYRVSDSLGDISIIEALKEAKMGHLYIKQVFGNKTGFEYEGECPSFGQGLSAFIETPTDYYYTSIITEINWDEGYFDTINSRYEFKFTEENYE